MNLNDFINDTQLATQSLTHRSYCNEHPSFKSNERLEFLGDSVLSIIISERLFRLIPNSSEGELTSRRSYLVQTSTLARKAIEMGLPAQLLLSRGEEESGGRDNPGLLANTFEAVLGAIFISAGLEKCRGFLDLIFTDEEITSQQINTKDPKSLLQELSQARGWGTPVYNTVSATGPDHAKIFTLSVSVNSQVVSTGNGPSKQKAEIAAASAAVEKLFPNR